METIKKYLAKIDYNSPVILTFVFLSLFALLLGFITNNWTTVHLFSVYRSSLLDPLTLVRMFGHVLGHANWQHYISNMMLILVIGPSLEEKYGSKKLLACIIVTAFASGLLQFIFFPSTALLGASGIVFMMIILSSFGKIKDGFIPLTLILVALLYLGQEIYTGFFVKDNISQLTHILGGLCGIGFGFIIQGKKE